MSQLRQWLHDIRPTNSRQQYVRPIRVVLHVLVRRPARQHRLRVSERMLVDGDSAPQQ